MHPALKWFWDRLPRAAQDAIAMAADRRAGIAAPEPPAVPDDSDVAVFIGPTNYAGQATRWCRAAEQNPRVVGRSMMTIESNVFSYPVDHPVRWRTMMHSREWQEALFSSLAERYTHVVFEAEMPLLGGMFGGDVRTQVRALQAAGLTVAMLAHGTDARLPSGHRKREPWSYYANDDWVPVERLEKEVQGNLDLLAALGCPTFVSTAGLLADVPFAQLLPVVIDPARWASTTAPLDRRPLRVLHAPSNPLIKGTFMIEPVIERLAEEGLVEYRRVQHRPQDEMPAFYAEADIFIDQLRVGDYGVAACEAMAAGRLVVSHVSEQVRTAVQAASGAELPIIEANPDTLEDVLRAVIAAPDRYRAAASAGPDYIAKVHDGRLSRSVLEQYLFGL